MKKLKSLFLVVFVMFSLQACTVSTEDLAKEVRASIEETVASEGIIVKDFTLIKKGGNEYRGLLLTEEPYGEFTYSVDVTYDGETFMWEIIE